MSTFVIDTINTSGLFAQSAYSAATATYDSEGNEITSTYLTSLPDDIVASSFSATSGLSASGVDILTAINTISGALSNVGSFEIVPLTTATPIVPDVADPNTKTMYLTKATTATVTDPYKEWIYLSGAGTTGWECIGDMSVDLSNYYTKSQSDGRYCTDSNAKIYSNFAGGNGIVVAGELTQTKSINSILNEYQLQEGVGITFEVDDVNETVKFNAKPEIFLYYTSTPQMTYSTAIAFDSTNSAFYHSKSGSVGISNTEITGLDTTKLYHCNAKLLVDNAGNTPETVSVKATNWHNTDSITYEYVNSSNSGTMELDWYIKGITGCALTGGGNLSNDVQIGVKELMITEVCYA